ncbi:hypothetical protein [Haloferula sp.]|uniref:hypothetical protein n=1 Tax=Haloferula sp. TaxID=2497595 RepID=UPI00329E5BC1
MKAFPFPPLIASFAGFVVSAQADLYVTNFDSVTSGVGGSASGVWREVTNPATGAGNDSTFEVTLTTGGDVQDNDGSAVTSRIDESFPWRDLAAFETVVYEGSTFGPLPFAVNLPFAAGTSGDFINIETPSPGISVVVIEFGAMITDPMLSFSDIDIGTTISFTDAFVVAEGTTNLTSTPTSVGNSMIPTTPPFDEEAAGSLQFSGSFSQLSFTITNNHPLNAEDRTGFVVSTETEPAPLTAGPSPELMVNEAGGMVTLTWTLGEFTEIHMSDPGSLSGFSVIPGLDPGSVSTWSEMTSVLGDQRFFRGIYTP